MKTCKVDGCNCEVTRYPKQQLCNKHYTQIYRYGKILDRTSKDKNEIVLYEDYAEIILYNKNQDEVGRALIDIEDVEKVKNYKWYKDSRGYAYCGTSKKSLHRLIIEAPKGKSVDHINHDRLDNRKCNLRICTSSQNSMNRRKLDRNTSGHVGVCYKPKINKWQAYITVNRKPIHLGYYKNIEEAIEARKQAEIKYFGEYRNKE